MLLAGDVGGTNMRLALFEEEDGRLVEKRRARFATRDLATLHDAFDGFLAGEKRLEAAAFGVAGPVRHGRAEGTNVAFSIDAEEIGADLGVPAVVLNDLEANAWGLAELGPGDFDVLNRGEEDPTGNGALISAGTGLGEALLFRSGRGFVPMPSKGGTRPSPPQRRGDRAPEGSSPPSRARLLGARRLGSGPGDALPVRARPLRPPRARVAQAGHRHLRRSRSRRQPRRARRNRPRLPEDDAPLRLALRRRGREPGAEDPRHRGVYVGGGIAPKILPLLRDGFFTAFAAKGRFGPLLARIPIRVVLNDSCAIFGAARAAARAAADAAARAGRRDGKTRRGETVT